MLKWNLKEGESFVIPEGVDRVTVVEIGPRGVKLGFGRMDPLDEKLLAKEERKTEAKDNGP